MAKNMVRALRLWVDGRKAVAPAEYDDNDDLYCVTPLGRVEVAADAAGDQVTTLIDGIRRLGFEVEGCYSCRYFHSAGVVDDATEGVAGYCLEGKLGRHLDALRDLTTKTSSCDAYTPGSDDDRREVAATWSKSIEGVPWRPEQL